jgi:hypothetical protein
MSLRDFLENITERGAATILREEVDYQKFYARMFSVVFLISVSAPWVVYLLTPDLSDFGPALVFVFPIFQGKLSFISLHSPYIIDHYVGSAFVMIALVPTVTLINACYYFKYVVLRGLGKRADRYTAMTTILLAVITALLCDAVFFDSHESYNPRYPGHSGVIFSYAFPIFSGLTIFFTCMFSFTIVLGVSKSIFEVVSRGRKVFLKR